MHHLVERYRTRLKMLLASSFFFLLNIHRQMSKWDAILLRVAQRQFIFSGPLC